MLIMPPSPCFWAKLRKKKAQIPKKTSVGTIHDRRVLMKLLSVAPRNLTLYFARSEASSGSTRCVMKLILPFSSGALSFPSIRS